MTVVCLRHPHVDNEEIHARLHALDCAEWLPFDGQSGRCARCGTALTGRRRRWCRIECENEWRRQHDWGLARNAAKRRDGHQCVREGCAETTRLEVNHIVPRVGRGYGWGCWNHLDNLETLCHAHHLEVTAQQRAERKAPPVDQPRLFG